MDKLLKENSEKQKSQAKVMAKLSQLTADNKKNVENVLKNQSGLKPQVFYCRHMEVGVAGYEEETILVGLDAIKKMMPTFNGCPIYVYHVDNIDYENIRHEADGYVTDCFYNEKDGWIWAKFIAVTPEAARAIADGWSVSNAYIPKEWGAGGTWHNVDYNREITDGEFTHLAIVPNPRYEDAKIFTPEQYKTYQEELTNQLKQLHNSKNGEKKMFKLFKDTREEVTSIDEDTMVELEDGVSVKFSEMKNAVLKNAEDEKEKENEAEEEKMNMDSVVEVGDEKMPLKELVNKYKNMCKKNNEAEEDEKANESEEDEKANESEEDEKENEAEEEKKNALETAEKAAGEKHFDELKNAHTASKTVVELSTNKLARGIQRYGSNKS